jgi:hypothetical protein
MPCDAQSEGASAATGAGTRREPYDRGADGHEFVDHISWQDIRSAKRYRHRSRRQQQLMADTLDFGAPETPVAGQKRA